MTSGFGIFSLRMRRNGYLGASCQKSDPAIRSGDLDFLQDWYISTIRWRLRHIFDVLCTISYDLVTLSFDLLTLTGSDGLTHPTHVPIFSTLRLSIPELCVTQCDHSTINWNGHCACAVSRDLCIGGPPKPHVKLFWPRLIYSLYNFYGASVTIKGSLYWSISMLKRFLAAKSPVKIGSENGGFSEI